MKLLRVAAAVRAEHGRPAVGDYYAALGAQMWDSDASGPTRASAELVGRCSLRPGCPPSSAEALRGRASTRCFGEEPSEALALTGKDVGTPILHFQPPEGAAFFGPVISRLPSRRAGP